MRREGMRSYMASWTLPSLRPPMTRESMYVANELDPIHLQDIVNSGASPSGKAYIHKGREYIPNHREEKDALAAILVT